MNENDKINNNSGEPDKNQDCDCGSDCCPPKKRNKIIPGLIFAIVILAAIGIIFFKLSHSSSQVPTANKQVFRDPNAPAWSDSTKNSCCDTTKGSSCCPK